MMNSVLKFIDKYKFISLFISGLLFTLSFSPFYLLPFAATFLVLIRRIEKSESNRELFLVGLTFYFAHNLTLIPWLMNVSKYVSFLLIPGYFLACFGVALFYGVASIVTKKIGVKYLPFVFVFIEYLRQFGVLKFPWELSGYMFGFNNYFIQSADIFGVFGLSFLFYLFSLLIYFGIKKKNKLFYNLAAALFLVNFIYGYMAYNKNRIAIDTMNIGVLQSNISQDIKWKSHFKDSTYIIYENLLNNIKSDSLNMVLWAETAIPAWVEKSKIDRDRVAGIVQNSGVPNYIGSLRFVNDITALNGYKYYNSMFMFDKYGNITDHYDKKVLVQFGEYVPFGNILTFLNKIDFGQSNFSSDSENDEIMLDKANISTFICFEILFPNYVREQVKKGSNLIFTTSNDAWFEYLEPEQHFEMARFRAIENRRYLVRTGNIGVSAIVAENGRVVSSIDVKKRGSVVGKVKLLGENSFYCKFGDWIVYLSLIIILYRFVIITRSKNNNK